MSIEFENRWVGRFKGKSFYIIQATFQKMGNDKVGWAWFGHFYILNFGFRLRGKIEKL